MKHSKKLQQPQNQKFSCFLACFGGGQPSGKKLAFDHSKKNHHHHHNHRWLLSPYWSKVRLKKSASSSKTVPFEFFGVSPPTPSVGTKSLPGGDQLSKYANVIAVVEKPDQEVNLKTKESIKSSNHKIPTTSMENMEQDLFQKTKKSNSKSMSNNKTQSSTRHNKSCMHEKASNNNASMRLSSSSKLDPLVGLSIVLLTLLIMIIWGKLCAILCTSAWFYFVPMFQWKEEESKCQNENLNVKFEKECKSWRMKDYKKRVVLEGFLERENGGRVSNETRQIEMFYDCDE